MFRSSIKALPQLALGTLLSTFLVGQSIAATLTEGFDSLVGGAPVGWATQNNSAPVGSTNWFQGNTTVFPAQSGAPDSYVAANYDNAGENGTISNWLISPTMIFNNGDTISFYTRSPGHGFADRLELRFSDVGGTNVGTTSDSVGDFDILLSEINPTLDPSGYPSAWTSFSAILSGLSGPTSGAFAFHYYVPNGGPNGDNSDYIGLDTVNVSPANVPLPSAMGLILIGLVGLRTAAKKHKARGQ